MNVYKVTIVEATLIKQSGTSIYPFPETTYYFKAPDVTYIVKESIDNFLKKEVSEKGFVKTVFKFVDIKKLNEEEEHVLYLNDIKIYNIMEY